MNQWEETTTQVGSTAEEGAGRGKFENRPATTPSPVSSLLLDVKLPIRVLLGRTQLCLRDVAQLGGGSVVELDCSPNDPVDIIVNDRVIAQGEVVVVAGNYGVRITGIPGREVKGEPAIPQNDLLNLSEGVK
ncbi:MAG TPA: flagellar motor switch protein FliN [Bryobacteraceae bacterium]|nr:flagellar motor switch protein FliN [Bryobacteraceae bacterium]